MHGNATKKLMIITKNNHAFITINGNVFDFEHLSLLEHVLGREQNPPQIELPMRLVAARETKHTHAAPEARRRGLV